MKQTVRAALLLLILGGTQPGMAAEPAPVDIAASAIAYFRPGTETARFGALDYRGGFSFRPSDRRLHGISGLRFTQADGGDFLAVTDTGFWFSGRITRDAEGRPTGIAKGRIAPILDSSGMPQPRKGDADAEGLALAGDRVLVSFERDHRVVAYDAADPMSSAARGQIDFHIPPHELRRNQGLEAIATAPGGGSHGGGPLAGKSLVVSEQSLDRHGNHFAALLGPGGGVFSVVRHPPWHVTDAAFLPDGDLVLLERRYEGFGRIGMRLRQLAANQIAPGARVDGVILMEVDGGYEIDNMEALDIFRDADGHTVLAIASDDNGSLFQRNLYLEFRLRESAQGRSTGASR